MTWYHNIKAEIIDYKTHERLSPVEFLNRVKLRELELKKLSGSLDQSIVLLFKPNSLHFLIDLFALWNCGACVVPSIHNMIQAERDILTMFTGAALSIDEEGDHLRSVPVRDTELNGIALLLFTSGTTGNPKGVKISHLSLNQKMNVLKEKIPADEIKNTFCALPVFFGHGLICNTLFPMLNAEKFIMVNGFTLEFVTQIDKFINDEKINFFSTVPSVWDLILNFSAEAPRLQTLKRVHCASSNLVVDKINQIKKWVGSARLFDIYGITEMLGWVGEREILQTGNEEAQASHFDKFWDLQSIVENDELMLKSGYMFSGYYKKELNEAFDKKGFFATGDLFLNGVLKSRKKEVVIKSGMKIYLTEIDSLMLNSKLVEDACAYSFSDDFAGERLGLALVLKKDISLEEIKNFIKEQVTDYKRPDEYLVLSKLDRTGSGKVNRKIFLKLRENG